VTIFVAIPLTKFFDTGLVRALIFLVALKEKEGKRCALYL